MSSPTKSYAVGVFLAVLSAFLWATVHVSTRYLMGNRNSGLDPATLSLVRFTIGGTILFAVGLLNHRGGMFRLARRDFLTILLLSALSFVAMSVFLFWGQRYTTAINSAMIMALSPLLIMLIGTLAGVERPGRRGFLGMAVSLAGCVLVLEVVSASGVNYSLGNLRGDGLILISALAWASGAAVAKKIVGRVGDVIVTAWTMVFAAAMLFVMVLVGGEFPDPAAVSGETWLLVAYLGVFPTALAFYAWNGALRRVSLNTTSILQFLTPITAMLLAWGILREELTVLKVIGAVLILGGVAIGYRREAPKG